MTDLESPRADLENPGPDVLPAGTGHPVPDRQAAPRSRVGRCWSMAWKIALGLLLTPVLQVAPLRFVDPPFTAMMLFQAADNLLHGRPAAWKHENCSRERISPWLFQAVVAAEDQRFFQHRGFDLVEIDNARQTHQRHPRKPLRGASTVSQQVAKNLFLPPWRSFVRKGVEAYYTLLVELLWPKWRILEMYANIAEFAPGVYGAQAAARFHFRKDAARLSRNEAALLAAVLPNPRRWSASRPTPYILSRSSWIQQQMAQIGPLEK